MHPLVSAESAKRPTGPNAALEWDELCRVRGIVPLTLEETAALPPWTEEAATVFRRAIEEAFEQVEKPAHSS